MTDQRAVEAAYDALHDKDVDPEWHRDEIQPSLASFTLPMIAKATGVSTSAAAKWRAGRAGPHPRHWAALGEMVGADDGASPVPVQVLGVGKTGTLSGVAALTSSGQGFCALLTCSGVDCWGYGDNGELGNGTLIVGSAVPVQVR
jgi:hypothetical protein